MSQQSCSACGSTNIEITTGGYTCRDCKTGLHDLVHRYRATRPEPYTPVVAAGHCGKCGAPYTVDFNGSYKPLCVCWNLPKLKWSINAGGTGE